MYIIFIWIEHISGHSMQKVMFKYTENVVLPAVSCRIRRLYKTPVVLLTDIFRGNFRERKLIAVFVISHPTLIFADIPEHFFFLL